MAYSRDLPKMAVWHYGLKLQWYLTADRNWRFGMVWQGLVWSYMVWYGLVVIVWYWWGGGYQGWLSWITVMDDSHGWLRWMMHWYPLSCYHDWKDVKFLKKKHLSVHVWKQAENGLQSQSAWHGISWTFMDCNGISWTVMDCHRLS